MLLMIILIKFLNPEFDLLKEFITIYLVQVTSRKFAHEYNI
jgi:hypothetical protein